MCETGAKARMDDYEVGRKLVVAFDAFARAEDTSQPLLPSKQDLRLEIVKTFEPFSLCVVCEVKLVGQDADLDLQRLLGLPHAPKQGADTFILKLYDRRYDGNNRLRKGRPYNEAHEVAYREYVAEHGLNAQWREEDDDYDEDADSNYGDGDFEAILEKENRETFDLESEIYARITTGLLKGDHPAVPYFFGTLAYESAIGTIRGILMEKVHPAISLFSYLVAAGSCYHSDEAIRSIIHRVGEGFNTLLKYDYMNTDNRIEDILLKLPNGLDGEPKTWQVAALKDIQPAFIDFGIGRLRHPEETDREWLYTRWQDGEWETIWARVRIAMHIATGNECDIHGPSCWPEPMPADGYRLLDWRFPLDEAYVFKPANEEEQQVIDIWCNELDQQWGTWDKPYPRTMQELAELRLTLELDSTDSSSSSGGSRASSSEPDGGTLTEERPATSDDESSSSGDNEKSLSGDDGGLLLGDDAPSSTTSVAEEDPNDKCTLSPLPKLQGPAVSVLSSLISCQPKKM